MDSATISDAYREIQIERFVVHELNEAEDTCLVFFGGIHGNEPSGISAMKKAFGLLREKKVALRGNVYGVAGNLKALASGKRFLNRDLNRLWSEENIERLASRDFIATYEEEEELQELWILIQKLLQKHNGPFYFFDLHTTSSPTIPFLTVNDSLLNRQFTMQYPAPLILGIEEYLDGPLLSYLNELGYISFGFESGQHESPEAETNHLAFIMLSLVFTGLLDRKEIDYEEYFASLGRKTNNFFEIYHRQKVAHTDEFSVNPGFKNFQKVNQGQLIATQNKMEIRADHSLQIFMPLYQNQGNDGFFYIRPISPTSLKLSKLLRRLRIDRLLSYLPGIKRDPDRKGMLHVNLGVAKFFRKEILHLLGYREISYKAETVIIRSREENSKVADYKNSSWN
ncbi:MAG: succinylglutamate desuccinylase/aspartoacylase family protein [Bacteroidota bacterium]